MEVITRQDIPKPGDVVLITERSRPGGNYGDKVEYRTFAAVALTPLVPDPDNVLRALAASGVYVPGADNWQPGAVGLPATFGEWGVVGVEVIGIARPYGKVQNTAGSVARLHAHRLGRELRNEVVA